MKAINLLLGIVLVSGVIGCSETAQKPGGSGMLEADESTVSSEVVGKVLKMNFDEGTPFKAGDTLLVIDTTNLQLQLAAALASRNAASAQLETAQLQVKKASETESYAQTERNRVATLLKSGTSTQQKLDQLDHDLAQAKLTRQTAQANVTALNAQLTKIDADINLIRQQLDDCFPIAPIPGIVTDKYIDKGEFLAPGKAIAKISRLDSLWVKVYLPAGQFANIKLGDSATVNTESGGKKYVGRVVWTSDEAEFTPKNVQTEESRANLVYAVKVRMANSDGSLKIGMPVFVTIGE
jgi:HlyD family secretion protein